MPDALLMIGGLLIVEFVVLGVLVWWLWKRRKR
jgi:NhaP-type Na+/H+ or K+/H+ antiporter